MYTEARKIDEDLLARARKLRESIGDTPLVPIRNLLNKPGVQLFAKQEWKQLSGSVKARAAYNIILHALESGALNRNKVLLDATSGNTGIAYAAISKKLGLKVSLCLPENASRERKEILEDLGVEIIYTSKFEGTDGAQQVARELAQKHPDQFFYADQYKNPNNWKAHYHGTAVEIFTELPSVTHFIAGLGTTGTFVGTGRRLKELNPSIRLISLQPDSALHALEGWKHLETAVVPAIYDPSIADESWEVSTEEAYEMLRAAAQHEDLLLSPSSAANLVGALRLAHSLEEGVVVTMLPDNADKYSEVLKRIL